MIYWNDELICEICEESLVGSTPCFHTFEDGYKMAICTRCSQEPRQRKPYTPYMLKSGKVNPFGRPYQACCNLCLRAHTNTRFARKILGFTVTICKPCLYANIGRNDINGIVGEDEGWPQLPLWGFDRS